MVAKTLAPMSRLLMLGTSSASWQSPHVILRSCLHDDLSQSAMEPIFRRAVLKRPETSETHVGVVGMGQRAALGCLGQPSGCCLGSQGCEYHYDTYMGPKP